MHDLSTEKAGGGATPTGPVRNALDAIATSKSHETRKRATRIRFWAIGPDGRFAVVGQTARALKALVAAGKQGVTALELSSWALRLAAYVEILRKQHGLKIETLREKHDGGSHGRYILHSKVQILECGE